MLREIRAFFIAIGVDGRRPRRARGRGRGAAAAIPARASCWSASPRREAVEEAIAFARELRSARLALAALVVNRVHEAAAGRPPRPATLEPLLGERLAGARRARASRERGARAAADARALERLRAALRRLEPVVVPDLAGEVYDIEGLRARRARARLRRPRSRSDRLALGGAVVVERRRASLEQRARGAGCGSRSADRAPRRLGSALESARRTAASPRARRASARRCPQTTSRSSARRWPSISAASTRASSPTATPPITTARARSRGPRARSTAARSSRQRAQRRDAPGEAPAARPLGLEQRAQREQVVGQAGERIVALAAELEALERPCQRARRPGAGARRGCRTRAARPPARPGRSRRRRRGRRRGAAAARHGRALAADPCQRRERDARARTGAARSAGRAAAPSAPSSAPGPSPGTIATTVAGPLAVAPQRVGRQHLELARAATSSTPSASATSADSQPRPRAAARAPTSSLRPARRQLVELAVGGLEALGRRARSRAAPSKTRCAKQRSASCAADARRAALAARRCRGTRRARRASRAPPARRRRGRQPRQAAPSGARRSSPVSGCVAVEAGRGAVRALLDDLERDLVAGGDRRRRASRRPRRRTRAATRGAGATACRRDSPAPRAILPAQRRVAAAPTYAATARRSRPRRRALRDLLAQPAAAVVRACSR